MTWYRIRVKMVVKDLLGSIPDQKELQAYVEKHYLKEFKGDVEPDIEVPESAEPSRIITQRFRRDETGIYLVKGQVYGWLKDCIRALGLQRKLSKVWLRVIVYPPRIYLKRKGGLLKKADGIRVRPVRGPYGSVLCRHEWVWEAEVRFTLWTQDRNFALSWDAIKAVGQQIGLGPGRNKGDYGRIVVLRDEVRELAQPPSDFKDEW